ncbi:MAG: DUF881 domain-containing protein [Clostridia bacterium]|nr:DUF881 domain-containing protein [Clostridia bacterium]
MKKEKITLAITIAISCIALAFVMCMQFKIVNETDITSIETMRSTELQTELANWKSKYQEIEKEYDEVNSKINEYKTNSQENVQNGELLKKELEQVDMSLGKTDVQGQGIIITLRENGDETMKKITADDLLLIVNSLKLAGAEAISVNDERIINMTDIVNIADSFVKINGQRILPPYVIKVIGNQSYLESGLMGNGGQVDTLQKNGQDVSVEKVNKIKINKYSKDITYKYMN